MPLLLARERRRRTLAPPTAYTPPLAASALLAAQVASPSSAGLDGREAALPSPPRAAHACASRCDTRHRPVRPARRPRPWSPFPQASP